MSVDPRSSDNATVVGVTVSSAMPIGVQHVRLAPGLNALYGKNGVGKTRLLHQVDRLLRSGQREINSELEARYQNEEEPIALRPSGTAFYCKGGIHLSAPFSRTDLSVDENGADLGPRRSGLRNVVSEFLRNDPWNVSYKATIGDDDIEWGRPSLPARSEPSLLSRLGLSEDDLFWFLKQGRWYVQPEIQRVFLCDPSPLDSPLTSRWLDATERWERTLNSKGSNQDQRRRFGRLVWEDERDYPWEVEHWGYPDEGRELSGNGSGLMPLPETLRLDAPPDWVAYPFFSLPTQIEWKAEVVSDGLPGAARMRPARQIWQPVIDLTVGALPIDISLNRNEMNRKVQANNSRGRAFGTRREPILLADVLNEMASIANNLLADLFADPPILRAGPVEPKGWLKGDPPIVWEANTSVDGPWFSPDQLGSAHLRYAMFAIERAVSQWQHSDLARRRRQDPNAEPQYGDIWGGTFTLIDEPERALHNAAELRLAGGAQALAERVLVSTHSTDFLEAASKGSGSAHLIERRSDGYVRVANEALSLEPAEREAIAEKWGMSLARLATLVGVYVFVEGPHDELLIKTFVKDELQRSRSLISPLFGTRDLHLVALTHIVVNGSDAPIVVCLDNSHNETLQQCMTELATISQKNSKHGYLSSLEKAGKFDTPEAKQILNLIKAAIDAGNEGRIHPFGFSKHDIVEYLGASSIHPAYSSWAAIKKAFLQETSRPHFTAGDGKAFKEWVNVSGGNYRIPGLRRVLKELEAAGELRRHRDFFNLAELLLELSSR